MMWLVPLLNVLALLIFLCCNDETLPHDVAYDA